MLTAFTEGSLLERERETALSHLATCPACREVLNISAQSVAEQQAELVPALAAASPAFATDPAPAAFAPTPAATPPPTRKTRLWLPWATVAACALVIGSFALVHIKHTQDAARLAREQQQIANTTSQALAKAPLEPSLSSSQPPAALEERHLRKKAPIGAMSESVTVLSPPVLDRNIGSAMRSEQGMAAHTGANPANMAAQSRQFSNSSGADMLQAKQLPAPQVAAAVPPPQQQAVNQLATGADKKPSSVNQTVTVQADALSVTPEPADLRPQVTNASVTPLSAELKAGAVAGALANAQPRWRIKHGHLQRAIGGGPWQPAPLVDPASMHVVSVFGNEAWVGGEDTRLYRSSDNGNTWQPVVLPGKNGPAHTITHIRFTTAQSITVQSSDGTSWTTSDAGATWN